LEGAEAGAGAAGANFFFFREHHVSAGLSSLPL
jgi:hypothetical protein